MFGRGAVGSGVGGGLDARTRLLAQRSEARPFLADEHAHHGVGHAHFHLAARRRH